MIACFSETTYPRVLNDSLIVITPAQLKQTNLIFLEHNKLKHENSELYLQIDNYTLMFKNYEVSLKSYSSEIDTMSILLKDYSNKIQQQEQDLLEINSNKKIWTGVAIGGITLSVSLLLILILTC